MTTTATAASALEWRVGAVAIPALGAVLLAWALTVDFPKATGGGFFSDGATYYSLAHSLAFDLDFQFRREDLVRARLERLRALGHIKDIPNRLQRIVGAIDMMRFFIVPAAA